MATIYNIKIKTVSPFIAYSSEDVKYILEKLINEADLQWGGRFENTEIEVEKQ